MINHSVIDGIRIYTKGPIKNKAIVFVHGNSLNSLTFNRQLEVLEFPILAFDLPGHGLSERKTNYEDNYCVPGYVQTLKNIISKSGINDFILVGHSLGGHIAIESFNEISGVKGLFIFGTPPIGIPPEMDKMFFPNPAMAYLFSKELSDTNAELLANEFVFNHPAVSSELKKYILQTDGYCRENLGASIGKGQFKNEVYLLEKSNIPVAVIHGEHDKMVNPEYIRSLRINNLWGNKIQLINSGHIPQMEQPEIFNQLIADFYHTVF